MRASDASLRKQGTINVTAAMPIAMVKPNACSGGVRLKPSKPKESKVLSADKPVANHAASS
jgi:hypothetical protein